MNPGAITIDEKELEILFETTKTSDLQSVKYIDLPEHATGLLAQVVCPLIGSGPFATTDKSQWVEVNERIKKLFDKRTVVQIDNELLTGPNSDIEQGNFHLRVAVKKTGKSKGKVEPEVEPEVEAEAEDEPIEEEEKHTEKKRAHTTHHVEEKKSHHKGKK